MQIHITHKVPTSGPAAPSWASSLNNTAQITAADYFGDDDITLDAIVEQIADGGGDDIVKVRIGADGETDVTDLVAAAVFALLSLESEIHTFESTNDEDPLPSYPQIVTEYAWEHLRWDCDARDPFWHQASASMGNAKCPKRIEHQRRLADFAAIAAPHAIAAE